MIGVGAMIGVPIVLMAQTLAVDSVLKHHPNKDDLWQLPKVSSVSFTQQRS